MDGDANFKLLTVILIFQPERCVLEENTNVKDALIIMLLCWFTHAIVYRNQNKIFFCSDLPYFFCKFKILMAELSYQLSDRQTDRQDNRQTR